MIKQCYQRPLVTRDKDGRGVGSGCTARSMRHEHGMLSQRARVSLAGAFSGILMKTLGRDPRNDLPSASGSMVADVVTLLTVIITGSAVVLAHGRRDA